MKVYKETSPLEEPSGSWRPVLIVCLVIAVPLAYLGYNVAVAFNTPAPLPPIIPPGPDNSTNVVSPPASHNSTSPTLPPSPPPPPDQCHLYPFPWVHC